MFEAGHANYVSVGRRYLASMYNAFTCGWAFKDSEFLLLLFGILITSFIYGTLAGVMGTLMMGRAAGDQAFAATLHSLKAWMVRSVQPFCNCSRTPRHRDVQIIRIYRMHSMYRNELLCPR